MAAAENLKAILMVRAVDEAVRKIQANAVPGLKGVWHAVAFEVARQHAEVSGHEVVAPEAVRVRAGRVVQAAQRVDRQFGVSISHIRLPSQ